MPQRILIISLMAAVFAAALGMPREVNEPTRQAPNSVDQVLQQALVAEQTGDTNRLRRLMSSSAWQARFGIDSVNNDPQLADRLRDQMSQLSAHHVLETPRSTAHEVELLVELQLPTGPHRRRYEFRRVRKAWFISSVIADPAQGEPPTYSPPILTDASQPRTQ